jgi:hypothetical protein
MNDDNVIELITPARLNRMRNLKPYRGKTDEELIEIIKNRPARTPTIRKKSAQDYDTVFAERLAVLQKEFAVDMNQSNDVETLKSLVRHQIQLEKVNTDIDTVQRKDSLTVDDYKNLKALGDFQRTITTSVNEFQDKLGISRKQRKEKAIDDIPKWIDSTLEKAANFFERKTTVITCPKCKIELGRFWLNFRNSTGLVSGEVLNNSMELSLQCWKCEEQVEHIQ